MNSHSFSSATIYKALKYDRPFKLKELGNETDNLEEVLDESGLFFCNFDNCGTREYLSKKYFFNGSQFTAHFTGHEEKNRVLCAPLRFLPFTREVLDLRVDGQLIPIVKKKFSLKCLEDIYSLDHGQELIKFINSSTEKTVFSLKAASGIDLDAYDFTNLEIKPGDHLRITLKDNSLEGDLFNSEELNLKLAQQWCESFEASLLGVLREFGPFSDVYSQLEMAFFYGEQSLRNASALAIRDFLKLSKKVHLVDFVFQKIIWFSESSPMNTPEVERKLALIHENFHSKPHVNGAFYSLLDNELKGAFETYDDSEINDFQAISKIEKQVQRTVRRIALWINNNKHIIEESDMPSNEILMFDAAFLELQFLCSHFLEINIEEGAKGHFENALEINFEILSELMAFLQEYYLSS